MTGEQENQNQALLLELAKDCLSELKQRSRSESVYAESDYQNAIDSFANIVRKIESNEIKAPARASLPNLTDNLVSAESYTLKNILINYEREREQYMMTRRALETWIMHEPHGDDLNSDDLHSKSLEQKFQRASLYDYRSQQVQKLEKAWQDKSLKEIIVKREASLNEEEYPVTVSEPMAPNKMHKKRDATGEQPLAPTAGSIVQAMRSFVSKINSTKHPR